MQDNQWTIALSDSDSLTFGSSTDYVFNVTTPDLGDAQINEVDKARISNDGISFGIDFRGSRTISFELGVRGAGEPGVRAQLANLARIWRADDVRTKAGATASLTARYDGTERTVFGRPRRFTANMKDAKSGYVTVVADFVCSDDRFYANDLSQQSISLASGSGGGFVFPFVLPMSTVGVTDRSVNLNVQGDLAVWPVVKIYGPVINPSLEVINSLKFSYIGSLEADQSITVDTQPWARTVLRENGNAVALSRTSTRLSNTLIQPGNHELSYRGADSSSLSYATVTWRDAYSSL
jgi:hypothetical protein